jgi:alpha-glucosidase
MYTISDHDGYDESPRAYTRISDRVSERHKQAAYRQALLLYAALPGTLSIYQGDELGLPHAKIPEDIPTDKIQDHIAYTKGMRYCRDGSRTPFPSKSFEPNAGFSTSMTPYLPMPNSHFNLAADVQEFDKNSTLNFTRDFIAWRKEQPAFRSRTMNVLRTTGDLVAFTREANGQTVLCAFNCGQEKFYFKPSDVMDDITLAKIGLTKGDVLVMHPFGAQFAGDYELSRKKVPGPQPEPIFGVPQMATA